MATQSENPENPTKKQLILYWCRRDFRLEDNPALYEALQTAIQTPQAIFLPVFILDQALLKNPQANIGYPRKHFLAQILSHFGLRFSNFIVIHLTEVHKFFEDVSSMYEVNLFYNQDIEPYARIRDDKVKDILKRNGGKIQSFVDQLSIDPNLRSGSGSIYSVFTPFRNAVIADFTQLKPCNKVSFSDLEKIEHKIEYSTIRELEAFSQLLNIPYLNCGKNSKKSQNQISAEIFQLIDSPWILHLEPPPSYQTAGYPVTILNLDHLFERPKLSEWAYTEEAIEIQLTEFLDSTIGSYAGGRDQLSHTPNNSPTTSLLSPALKWGLISARQIIFQIRQVYPDPTGNPDIFSFISELIWREFYRYLLLHYPNLLNQEFQAKYRFKNLWVDPKQAYERLLAWIKAETGYPLVDAGMTQIRKTGWMHNRTRMVVASVLTKNLGVDWRLGQAYFRAMLVDLDEASNNGGWQWAASVGADPKPMRIFNPYLQAEKFDPLQQYQKTWLGHDPKISTPILLHDQARQAALERYRSIVTEI